MLQARYVKQKSEKSQETNNLANTVCQAKLSSPSRTDIIANTLYQVKSGKSQKITDNLATAVYQVKILTPKKKKNLSGHSRGFSLVLWNRF